MKAGIRCGKKWYVPALLLSLMLVSSSCSQMRKLNSMAKDTAALSDNTNELSNKTTRLEKKLDLIRKSADALYRDDRQGKSLQVRKDFIDAMDKDKSFDAKYHDAAKYFMAYEFQLWRSSAVDTDQSLDKLKRDAVDEFFGMLSEFMTSTDSPIDPTSSDNRDQDVLALAIALHVVNSNQQIYRAQSDTGEVSMLTMIEDSLKKSFAVETGNLPYDQLKDYERIVQENQQMAVRLLQARANMLGAMLLSKITAVQDAGFLGKIWMDKVGSYASFDGLDVAQLNEVSTWIHEATRETQFLKMQGFDPGTNGNLKTFYGNMGLPDPGLGKRDLRFAPQKRKTRTMAESLLLKQIHTYLQEIGVEQAPPQKSAPTKQITP